MITCGSGVVHQEGYDHPGGWLHSFEVWVNVPALARKKPPQYQQLAAADVPVLPVVGGTARLLVGAVGAAQSPILPEVPVEIIDFGVERGEALSHSFPSVLATRLAYVYEGEGVVNGERVEPGQLLVLEGDLTATAGPGGLGFLTLAGKPLDEPFLWHGPFVVTAQQELDQAFAEYKEGLLVKEPPAVVQHGKSAGASGPPRSGPPQSPAVTAFMATSTS